MSDQHALKTREGFKRLFDKNYPESKDLEIASGLKESEHDEQFFKLIFLSVNVFDFTTYDSGIDQEFSRSMLEVIWVILNKKTFEYIEDENRYRNYLIMVNMPFLKDKLEWGTSIRGAWFRYSSYQHQKDKKMHAYCGEIEYSYEELTEFMWAIIEWSGLYENPEIIEQ